jgi:uncharacterized OsmC-like protein
MSSPNGRDLKTAIERNVKAITKRPSVGQGTATTRVVVRPGATTCDIRDGEHRIVADIDRGEGGDGVGPDPGVLVRAGLGACLAIGYEMWAARLGIPLDSIEVVVEADYDARGMYGVDDAVSPGWTRLRYTAHVESSAPAERVQELLDTADARSPVLDDLRRAINVVGEHRIAAKAKS